ncbi:MAG: hypothetical protein IJV16_00375, partial [Lachnospiraceae bacterium]|nr:hypothetical protein [Lachnospiraceae bacterium]
MKRRLEEYRIRYDKKRHHQFSFIDIPDVTCYTDVTEVSGMAEVEVFAYRTAESCVRAGYKTLLGSEPLFLISYGMEQVSFDAPPKHRRVMMCVPIDASETGEISSDEHIKLIPGCHAFSFLSYGPTNEPYKNFALLLQEVKKRELKMAGSVRGYGIVSPYVGSHIPEKDFVSRYVLPVERE